MKLAALDALPFPKLVASGVGHAIPAPPGLNEVLLDFLERRS